MHTAMNGTIYSRKKQLQPFSTPLPEAYTSIVGEEAISRLLELAGPLRGLKFLSINASAQGGGVAELLYSAMPFLNALGIEAEWKVIPPEQEFFECTKSLHNILQGNKVPFSRDMKQCYVSYMDDFVEDSFIDDDPELVLVHDPQPLGLAARFKKQGQKWLWRCHIDIEDIALESAKNLWDFMTERVEYYDASIFSAAHYIVSLWHLPNFVIPPFIDPLSEKNRVLAQSEIDTVLHRYGIDPGIPIMMQIGRFDPWKGIERSIAVFHEVCKEKKCQLVLAGGQAVDDPEGQRVFAEIMKKAGDDEDIHVLNLDLADRLGNWREVNALQRAASIVMQPSIREGFGLTVTEALWKGKPVIAGNAGAIPLQIRDGSTGYFYHTAHEAAQLVIHLLDNPDKAREVGERGREYVREHFLLPVRMTDWLRVMDMVVNGHVTRDVFSQCNISFHPWFKLAKLQKT